MVKLRENTTAKLEQNAGKMRVSRWKNMSISARISALVLLLILLIALFIKNR